MSAIYYDSSLLTEVFSLPDDVRRRLPERLARLTRYALEKGRADNAYQIINLAGHLAEILESNNLPADANQRTG